jgi:competence protein ComEA
VWAPVLLKLAGAALGMLGLAAIGASSFAQISHGSHAVPAAAGEARLAAGFVPLGGARPGTPPPAPPSSAAPATDAGTESDASVGDSGAPPAGALTPDGKVILNRAGINELMLLPGVGPKRAEAILALRHKLGGRFKRLSDLLRLKGIGPKGLKKIEAKAVLD